MIWGVLRQGPEKEWEQLGASMGGDYTMRKLLGGHGGSANLRRQVVGTETQAGRKAHPGPQPLGKADTAAGLPVVTASGVWPCGWGSNPGQRAGGAELASSGKEADVYLSGAGKASGAIHGALARRPWSLPLRQIATSQREARTASQMVGVREQKGAHRVPRGVSPSHCVCLPA